MPRTIHLIRSVQAIVRQLPDKQDVTYFARTSGDTFALTGTVFRARKQPRVSTHVGGVGYTVADWQLFADDGQEETAKPALRGKFTIDSGPDAGEWHIEGEVRRIFGDLVYECNGCVILRA